MSRFDTDDQWQKAVRDGVRINALAKSMGRAPNASTEPASPIGAALDLLLSLERTAA